MLCRLMPTIYEYAFNKLIVCFLFLGIGNNLGQAYGGSWSSTGTQNLGKSNPWASSGASAFASSNSGSKYLC